MKAATPLPHHQSHGYYHTLYYTLCYYTQEIKVGFLLPPHPNLVGFIGKLSKVRT
jgi:hypothetical protein